jgi:mannose/cellobiose epimerase-like protein (N-acyl-D-glucosamine 2-epimerase family)
VLPAGATATQAELPGGRALLDEAAATIDRRFWRENEGAALDSYDRTWTTPEGYRGQNSNMHLTEAYLASAEATGDARFGEHALCISDLIIRKHGAAHEWRVPEHFDTDWRPDLAYNSDRPEDTFRPYGSLVGHWLEWARLLVMVRVQNPRRLPCRAGPAQRHRTCRVRRLRDGGPAGRAGHRRRL